MAFTVTPVAGNKYTYVADVIASADGDTASPNIPHGLGAAPVDVTVTPLLQAPALLAGWAVTTIDATNVVITKANAVGSGNAGAQVRVIARLPHSMVR